MRVIVLTGLVSVEKAQLAQDLAHEFQAEQSVTIIDNIARLPIDTSLPALIKRFEGDIVPQFAEIVSEAHSDILIIALSEQTHPEKLFVATDNLREANPDWQIYTLAMIDIRTCDCFPNVRQALEMYADISVMIPYQLDDIVTNVSTR